MLAPARAAVSRALAPLSDAEIHPAVAGNAGRFVMFGQRMTASGGSTAETTATRFDWPTAAATPTVLRVALAEYDSPGLLGPPDVACDTQTGSHWVAVFNRGPRQIDLVRLGYDLNPVETRVVYFELGFHELPGPAVAWDGGGRFLLGFARTDQGAGVGCRALVYPAATSVTYGAGCGGAIAAGSLPLWGHELWPANLAGAGANVPAVLLVGFAPAAIPLAFLGMGTCPLNIDPGTMISLPSSTSGTGAATRHLPLPAPGELFLQWAFLSPGTNQLGLAATTGLQASVR